MIDNIKDLLIRHEGYRTKFYYDSLGYVTVGVGHLADPRKGAELPREIVDRLFELDLAEHERLLVAAIPWVTTLSPVRYAVLVDMAFNLGPEPFDGDRVKDWPNFVQQVKDGKYEEAAKNMLSTTWAKQVGPRAARLAKMMETNQWPEA